MALLSGCITQPLSRLTLGPGLRGLCLPLLSRLGPPWGAPESPRTPPSGGVWSGNTACSLRKQVLCLEISTQASQAVMGWGGEWS